MIPTETQENNGGFRTTQREPGCWVVKTNYLDYLKRSRKFWFQNGKAKFLSVTNDFDVRKSDHSISDDSMCVCVLLDDNRIVEIPVAFFTQESREKLDQLQAEPKSNFQYVEFDDDNDEEYFTVAPGTSPTSNIDLLPDQIQFINYDDWMTSTPLPDDGGRENLDYPIKSIWLDKDKKLIWNPDQTGKILTCGEDFDVDIKNGTVEVNFGIDEYISIQFPTSAFTPESQGKWDNLANGKKLIWRYW